MEFKDDILNVYGLLRKKSAENLQRILDAARKQETTQAHLDELNAGIDELEAQLHQLAAQNSRALEILQEELAKQDAEAHRDAGSHADVELKVHIDPDYDFESAFRALVREAETAGFADTRAEDLLSADDMRRVEERCRQIDERFSAETGLRTRDIGMLMIASAIKITVYCLGKCLPGADQAGKDAQNGRAAGDAGPVTTGAADGAGLSGVKELAALSDRVYSGGKTLAGLRGKETGEARVLDSHTIINEPVPFDLSDNSCFSRSEVIGFDPILGWLFGAVNFMTNTVTTTRFDSFSVVAAGGGAVRVGDRLSTPVHVFYPVVREAKKYRDSIVAAVIREADVLKASHAPIETVSAMMETAFDEKEQAVGMFSCGRSFESVKEVDLGSVIKRSSLTAFIDLLTVAVCAVLYDPERDGDPGFYSLRIHKVLLMSNAFAAIVNSIPALAAGDVSAVDYSGVLNTLVSLFHTAKFWIDVKTGYLVSEYKKEIDNILREEEKYFA